MYSRLRETKSIKGERPIDYVKIEKQKLLEQIIDLKYEINIKNNEIILKADLAMANDMIKFLQGKE